MASSEDRAYEIMRELDVNYVLVIFGGLTGYASDGKLTYYSTRLRSLFHNDRTFFTKPVCPHT